MKYFFCLIFFSSCTYFVEKFQSQEQNEITLKKNPRTYCPQKNKNETILINANKKVQQSFLQFLQILQERSISTTSIEKSVLWAMIQMNSRPDLASPTSRFQAITSTKKKSLFWDFQKDPSSPDIAYPFLYGLEKILDYYSSKSLTSLARLIDLYYPNAMFISEDFQAFIKSRESEIQNSSLFKEFYTRSNELIKMGESLPKIKFGILTQNYLNLKKKMKIRTSNHLYEFSKNSTLSIQCNFDMRLYSKSVFLINPTEIVNHIYGLKRDDFMFMGLNGQEIDKLTSINQSPLLAGNSNIRMASLCSYNLKKELSGFELWLISDQSRDPGQHLYHLYQYGLEDITSIEDLDTLVRFSRHQFLTEPLRLIYESQRGTKAQLDELLKLNIPVYNSFSLGNIWGNIRFRNQLNYFVLDDRTNGNLSCWK